jgi:protein phosphatase methylesterase 1
MEMMEDEERRKDSHVDASSTAKTPNPNWTRFGGLHQPKTSAPKTSATKTSRLGTLREEDSTLTPTSTLSDTPTITNAINGGKPPRNASADMPPPPARAIITPEVWNDDGYFDEKITVENEREEAFCVYRAADIGIIPNGDGETVTTTTLVCLHGCPYSSLSWAPFVKEFRNKCKTQTKVEIYAIDLRHHGESISMRDSGSDFSLGRMVEDVAMILKHLFSQTEIDRKCVLIGHSMGASVASSLALREDIWTKDVNDKNKTSLAGLIVVDVVEGSALKALPMMSLQLLNRPTSFRTMRDAFRWCLGFGGSTKSVESARISFPSQLQQKSNGNSSSFSDSNSEREDASSPFTFRCDVVKTEPYWKEWYLGMSERFLSAKTSKALLLAGTDRLDTPLTIAQMQGKFQMVVFPNSGHAIQEDEPEKFAQVVQDFLARYVQN